MQNYLSPIQAYSPSTPTTPQDKNPSTPTTPSTSKREDAKLKRLRTLLSAIGENGASLKVLMEAMLSYYLTNKGREALTNL